MLLKHTLKQFFFALLFISITNTSFAQLQKNTKPNWITEQTYTKEPDINTDDLSYGILTLLSDEQVHIPKQERYIRVVKKITDNVGIQDGSSISVNFDPTYQKLMLHSVNVIRDNKILNKLNLDDFQTIRQESNSESYIYDGSLDAIANLSDIRNGDIIDISYTVKGFNPIHKDHFSGSFSFNDYQPIGKIHINLISKTQLNYKTINSEIEPSITNVGNYTKYEWENSNTQIPEFEENTVSWHFSYQNLFVSDYKDWDSVVNWALGIYDNDANLSKDLRTKIDAIKKVSNDEGYRIKETLKFVQNEIRYLGLESGIGAYKPFTPNKVINQRFGDCKDKSWLMVTMLREMDIKAYPVLINTTYGAALDEFLPSPKVFDHVVVKVVDSTNASLFYDPTITNQEGNYNRIAFPNYGKGLVIKKGVNNLETIINESTNLVEVFDIFDVNGIGNDATLNVTTVYYDSEADAMRSLFKTSSLSSISKDFQNFYKSLYTDVEVIEKPIFEDDSIANKFTVEEKYRIDDIWTPLVGNENNIALDFTPYSIYNAFISPTVKERKSPFALYHPTYKKHNITVKLPRSWGIKNENLNINSKSFDFTFKGKTNPSKNILYLNYTYKNKNNFVLPEDFEDYYTKAKELEQVLSYYIYIPKSEATNKKTKSSVSKEKIEKSIVKTLIPIILFIVLVIAVLIIYVVRSNRARG